MLNIRNRKIALPTISDIRSMIANFKWRLGIGEKLLSAFIVVAGLIVAAGGIAFISYNTISVDLRQIEANSLPKINDALTMARHASDMATISAMFGGINTREDLKKINDQMPAKKQALLGSIKDLKKAGVDKKTIEALQEAADDLIASGDALADTVDLQLDHTDERIKFVNNAIAAHQQLHGKLTPLIDKISSRVVSGFRALNAGQHTAPGLGLVSTPLDVELTYLQTLKSIRAESNLLLGVLNESAMVASDDAFPPFYKRIGEIAKRLKEIAGRLPKNDKTAEITKLLNAFLVFADENSGVTDARQRELSIMADNWALIDINTVKASELASQVAETAKLARQDAINAVAGSSANISQGKVLLTGLVFTGILCVIMAWIFIRSNIIARLQHLNSAVLALADGDLTVAVPHNGHDELAKMGDAVETFKQNALKVRELEAEQAKDIAARENRQRRIEEYIATFEQSGLELSSALIAASLQIETTAKDMSTTANDTSRSASSVNAAAGDATAAVNSVASAVEELSASIREIAQSISQSSGVAERAVHEAKQADTIMQGLSKAAGEIDAVIQLIDEVAAQTNMLALNATIEAARAGEAGRGFAVVASEVKSLASETGKATQNIRDKISSIQTAVGGAVTAIKRVDEIIGQMNQISTTIADAISQQESATNEIASSTQTAAGSAAQVSESIRVVDKAAATTDTAADGVVNAAAQLGTDVRALSSNIDEFLSKIRAA
ncbi:MAG: methyl-accepting chemotaxis protein [Alphaproteobacteria bacterium]